MSKREVYASDFPGLDPVHVRGMTVPPPVRSPSPVGEAITLTKFHQMYYETVDDHDLTTECHVQRHRAPTKKSTLVVSCRTHLVQWAPTFCNALSDKGIRCKQLPIDGSLTCAFHEHPRIICDDCGHNVYVRDEGDRTRLLHRDDHRFDPDASDGRYCADCSLPGRMLDDGRIVHRWDHQPKPVDLPWETVDDDETATE